jgi:deoxyribodipyrimidine photolyase-related protein
MIPHGDLYVWNSKLKDINSLSEADLEIRFPVTISGAKRVLKYFIKTKLNKFGTYQDIILDTEHSLLYHAGISPMLNIGILTPRNVINEVVKVLHSNNKNLNSIEGFIRQILGWREFCRYTYIHHSKKYLNKNYFNSRKSLKIDWYNGTTKLAPVNLCIEKAFRFGYLHHIERLMIMANSMVLANIHPNEMYRWFTEFSLDSYDWVMEYNIYSMGSYSDGGVFTSKPYISSSNYVIKMSNYTKRNEWVSIWDRMFWLFMKKHKSKIKKIQRLSMLLKHIDKNLK